MGISYFNCDTCGVEINDCACELSWNSCSGCDATYCENCVTGSWVSCECSGFEYCSACVAAGQMCACGKFSAPFQPGRAEGEETVKVDVRPSDALLITMRAGVPFCFSEQMLARYAVSEPEPA